MTRVHSTPKVSTTLCARGTYLGPVFDGFLKRLRSIEFLDLETKK